MQCGISMVFYKSMVAAKWEEDLLPLNSEIINDAAAAAVCVCDVGKISKG